MAISIHTRGIATAQTQQGHYNNLVNEGSSIAHFGRHLLTATAGAVFGIGFGFAKSVAPDHTFVDKFSLLGIITGAIVTAFGLVGMYRGQKATKQSQEQNGIHIPFTLRQDPTLDTNLGIALHAINTDPHRLFKISNEIVQCNSAGTVDRGAIYDYFELLRSQEVETIITDATDPSVITITNLDGKPSAATDTSKAVNGKDLQDRFAVLMGHLMASRPTTGTDAAYTDITTNFNPKCFEVEESCHLEKYLPSDFRLVSWAADYFNDNFRTDNDAVTNAFGGLAAGLEADLTANNHNEIARRLKGFNTAYNSLKTTKAAIEYVLNGEAKIAADDKTIRNVSILKHALITGLQLQFNSTASISDQLREILNGAGGTTGLSAKVTEMETIWGTVQNDVRGGVKYPKIRLEEISTNGNAPYLQNINLLNITQTAF